MKGIAGFILLVAFICFTNFIPFGYSLSPILFEWWWLDIPFWEFTTPAIAISIANLVGLVVYLGGSFLEARQRTYR